MQTSLPSTAMGQRRLYERAADVISPNLFIIHSCGSTPMLCTKSLPPPLQLILFLLPCLSDFRRPSSFSVGRSTHTGVFVIQSPLYTFLCSFPNSAGAPNSTSLIEVVLQECGNTCTSLCILSIRSAPKRGSFAKAL